MGKLCTVFASISRKLVAFGIRHHFKVEQCQRGDRKKRERERGRKAHWIRFVQRDYLPKQFGLCAFATWKYRNDSITVELTEIAKYILLFILEIRWNLLRAYRIQLLHLTFQCALSRLSLIFFLPKKIEFSILLSGMFLFADL